jgi:DNA-directed RNA polymerase I, II, and III subunit RPABC3
MSQRFNLFEDNVTVTAIDKDGKVFDKVSRIEAKGVDSECNYLLDVNTDIYPMSKDSVYHLMISKSLYSDGSPTPTNFNYDIFAKKNSLLEKFDYVMHGKIFKYQEESDGKVSVYISFGGLLLGITGEPSHLSTLVIDDRVYLLMKKFE